MPVTAAVHWFWGPSVALDFVALVVPHLANLVCRESPSAAQMVRCFLFPPALGHFHLHRHSQLALLVGRWKVELELE